MSTKMYSVRRDADLSKVRLTGKYANEIHTIDGIECEIFNYTSKAGEKLLGIKPIAVKKVPRKPKTVRKARK